MPKLDVKLSGVPESISQGELRRVAVELRNIGQNNLVNIHLVSEQFPFVNEIQLKIVSQFLISECH